LDDHGSSVKVLEYEGEVAVGNAAYPISRVLWAYYNVLATSPEAADFLCSLVSSDAAVNAGSVPDTEAEVAAILLELGCV
jgi:ABC-type phosphate transport system substrate-binding protein